jgi:hypothetical protein
MVNWPTEGGLGIDCNNWGCSHLKLTMITFTPKNSDLKSSALLEHYLDRDYKLKSSILQFMLCGTEVNFNVPQAYNFTSVWHLRKINTSWFQIPTSASVKMTVFWDVALCNLVEAYRHFRGACCIFHQGDESASTSETSENFYQTIRCNIPEESHLQN